MDNHKKITEANRAAWNQAAKVHQKNRTVDLKEEFAKPEYLYLDETAQRKLGEIGVEGKRVAQLSCNNGREVISVVRMGAVEGVGFDISDEVIAEAEELARIAKVDCRFVRTDVYDISPEWDGQFDLVYITIGALAWLPDLERFFGVVARLLKPGGTLAMYEQHPFMYCMATTDEPEYNEKHQLEAKHSYFRTEPWVEDGGIDYIGKTRYESPPSYSYTQKVSDILNAMIGAGMVLREFQEYGHDISNLWGHVEGAGLVPLCYWLRAERG